MATRRVGSRGCRTCGSFGVFIVPPTIPPLRRVGPSWVTSDFPSGSPGRRLILHPSGRIPCWSSPPGSLPPCWAVVAPGLRPFLAPPSGPRASTSLLGGPGARTFRFCSCCVALAASGGLPDSVFHPLRPSIWISSSACGRSCTSSCASHPRIRKSSRRCSPMMGTG